MYPIKCNRYIAFIFNSFWICNQQENVVEIGDIHEKRGCLPGLKDIRECEHHPSTGQHHGRRLPWSQVPVSGRPIEHSQEIRRWLLFPPLSYCSEIRPHSCVQCSQRNLDSNRLEYFFQSGVIHLSNLKFEILFLWFRVKFWKIPFGP